MPNNRSDQLLDEYSRTVAQYGTNSTEVRVAADVLAAAGVDVPSNGVLYGGSMAGRAEPYTRWRGKTSAELSGIADLIEAADKALVPDELSTDPRWMEQFEPTIPAYKGIDTGFMFGGAPDPEHKTDILRGAKILTEGLGIVNPNLNQLSGMLEERVIQSRRKYGKDDPRSVEIFRQYKIVKTQKARSSTQSTWAKSEFQTYVDAPTKSNYALFIKAAEKTQAVSPLAPMPPEYPEKEDTRGLLFSIFLGMESAAGTTIYEARKKAGHKPIDWIEQTEGEEILKEITPSMALGITTRETPLFTPRGILGLLIDIRLDPLTYIKLGAKLVGRAGQETLEIAGKHGEKVVIKKEAIEILERQTKGIREAFPDVGIAEARRAAENLVVGITKHREELLAARKYQEPSLSIFGYPLFYWSDATLTTDKLWKKAPLYKQRTGIVGQVRETFEPYYRVTQAAGEYAKEVFAKRVRESEYLRDVWSRSARDIEKKYPRWFRKKEIISLDEQAAEYIERGIVPTDPRAYPIAEHMVAAQKTMGDVEVAEGLLESGAIREGYVYHVVRKEFKEEVLAKKFVMKEGGDPLVYLKHLMPEKQRTMEGSIKQINEWSMATYGIKALETRLPAILEARGIEHTRAVVSARLARSVGEELGIPAERAVPLAGRIHPKYTSEQIARKADYKYDETIDVLREKLGIPEDVEIRTAEDVMQYAKKADVNVDMIIKSLDEQIAAKQQTIEEGIWRVTDEGLLGKRPSIAVEFDEGMIGRKDVAPTITEAHITKTGKEAEEAIVDLENQRQLLVGKLETPYITEFESGEDVIQALASGKGYDVTKLRYVPKEETIAAKEARERADQYSRHLQSFYKLLEDIKTGEIRQTTIQDVEKVISSESGGMFAGMRPTKRIDGMPYTVREFMDDPLKTAKEYQHYQKQIFDKESDIIDLQASIAQEKRRPRPDIEFIELHEGYISKAQKSIEHAREMQAEKITSLQDDVSIIHREIIEPSERKIAAKRTIAEAGTTHAIEWGEELPSGIGAIPPMVSPMEWVVHTTERAAIQKQIDKLDVSIAAKKVVVEAQTKPAVESATYKKLVGETVDLVDTREQVVKFYADYGSLSPEELAAEAKRISKLPGIAGEDKAMFDAIADQQKTSKTLVTTLSKREEDIKKWQIAKGKPEAYPDDLIIDGKQMVKHQYTLTTGETRVSYVDPAVKEELERSMSVVMKEYDKAMRVVRYGYTMPWPAFHMRNIQGIIWQNLYAGVKASDYEMAAEVLHGDPHKIIDVPVYGKMKISEIREMLAEAGVTGKTGYVGEEHFLPGSGIIGKKLIEYPAGSMVEIESMGRTAVAMKRMMRDKESIDLAAHWARKLHFEYGVAGMTPREQAVFRRAALFYTWPKKNIGLQYRMAFEQPSTIATAMKGQQMMITPEEYEMLPPWAKDKYTIVMGGEYYVLDVPFVEGLQPWSAVSFMHSPALKVYAGIVSGHDWETGRSIGPADIPALMARSFGGRFQTTYRDVMKAERGDITTKQLAIQHAGGVYTRTLEDLPLETAYWGMKRYTWKPRKEDYIKAFEESGRLAEHYETLYTPPSVPRSEAFIEGKKWWEDIYRYASSPLTWGEFSKKDQYVGETGIVVGYTQEEWEAIGGHKLDDEQREEVKKIYESEGATIAALMRVGMAEIYHEARGALGGREPVTPKMVSEAYVALRERVGKEGADEWGYKTFYTEEGEPTVMPLTEEEIEEWGTWRPPEKLVEMFAEKRLTPEEERWNRMAEAATIMESAQLHPIVSGMLEPLELIEHHELAIEQQQQIYEHLQELKEETGFVPSDAQLEWAGTTKWLEIEGKRTKMRFGEQMEYFSKEYEAEQEQDRLMREELIELCEDPIGKTRSQKGIPAALMLTRGAQDIQTRISRTEELENLLGAGVDR